MIEGARMIAMAPKFGDGLRRRVRWLPGGSKEKGIGSDDERSRAQTRSYALQHGAVPDNDARHSTAPVKPTAPLSAKAALRQLLSSPGFVLVMLVGDLQ